jgi:hypothetical protein
MVDLTHFCSAFLLELPVVKTLCWQREITFCMSSSHHSSPLEITNHYTMTHPTHNLAMSSDPISHIHITEHSKIVNDNTCGIGLST